MFLQNYSVQTRLVMFGIRDNIRSVADAINPSPHVSMKMHQVNTFRKLQQRRKHIKSGGGGGKVKLSRCVNLWHRLKWYHSQGVQGMLSKNIKVFGCFFWVLKLLFQTFSVIFLWNKGKMGIHCNIIWRICL